MSGSSGSTSQSASMRAAIYDGTFTCAGDAAALLPNYQGLIFSEAQAGYLAGIVAGTITETNIIGTIGGIDTIPAVKLYIGGYENGARSVNPDVEVLVQYVSEDITTAFNDPTTGAALAEQMIGQDVDVIFQVAGLSGQGALEAACDADIYGIGVDVDQALALPSETCIVTSAEKKLVDAIDEAIQRVVDGEAVGGSVVLNAASRAAEGRRSRSSTTTRICSRLSSRRCSTMPRPIWHPAAWIRARARARARTSPIRTRANSARIGLSNRQTEGRVHSGPALRLTNEGHRKAESDDRQPDASRSRPRTRDARHHEALSGRGRQRPHRPRGAAGRDPRPARRERRRQVDPDEHPLRPRRTGRG